jgi:hypothetical protein
VGYQFNQDLSTKVRTEFLKSKSSDLKKFILSNPQFLIKKINNDLKNIDVLIFEVTDRSLDINGVARFHPTDLEIIKIIWTDWLSKFEQIIYKYKKHYQTKKMFIQL